MGNEKYELDLQRFVGENTKSFTSRPWGIALRYASKIDAVANENEHVLVRFPDEVAAINSPFLEEFLETVVLRFGREAFFKKFSFENKGYYRIDGLLSEAVNRILRTEYEYA